MELEEKKVKFLIIEEYVYFRQNKNRFKKISLKKR
jgi:hypothetical protein